MAFSTDKLLLDKLKTGDNVSWEKFYQTCRPLVFLRANDFHLNQKQKEELLQSVVCVFFTECQKFEYDPEKGRFRDYLKTIVSRQIYKLLKEKDRSSNSFIPIGEELFPDYSMEETWNKEWRNHFLKNSLRKLKETFPQIAYRAFFLYAVKGESPQTVAHKLNCSTNFVYGAKNRAIKILRAIVQEKKRQAKTEFS